VEITEVKITLRDEEKLKAFVSVTFDNAFVIRGLKIIAGSKGYFVSMPSRKRKDGSHQDIAHPINNDMRKKIEDIILDEYEKVRSKQPAAAQAAPSGESGGDALDEIDNADAPPADMPAADVPPADPPPADAPPADTPAVDAPPADTPAADAPSADTPPEDEAQRGA
jgi:stage V sporulation protein G